MSLILKNSILYGGERVLFLLIGIVSNALIARSLTVDEFGILNTAYSLVGVLGFMFGMGVELTIIKLIVNNKKEEINYLFAGVILRLLGSLGATIIFFIIVFYSNSDSLTSAGICLVIASAINSFALIDCIFQANDDAISSSLCKLLSRILTLIYQFVIAYSSPDIVTFAISNIIMSGSLCLFQFIRLKNYSFDFFNINKILIYIRLIYRKSWPIALSSVAVSVFLQSDILILSYLKGDEAVGLYSAITRLLIPAGFIAYAVSQAYYPRLVTNKNSSERFNNTLCQLMTLLLGFSVLGVVFINLFSAEILTVIYGSKYSIVSDVFCILSITLIFSYYGASSTKALIISDNQKHELYKGIISALLNIILNFILISKFELYGAAISSIISLFFANLLYFLIVKELRWIFFIQMHSIHKLLTLKYIIDYRLKVRK